MKIDYTFVFLFIHQNGSMAIQESALHHLLQRNKLPRCVFVVADNTYVKSYHLETLWCSWKLSVKDVFNFYNSLYSISVEQTFVMLINRLEVFWYPLKLLLDTCTTVIEMICKIHEFIISSNEQDPFDSLSVYENNTVIRAPFISYQNDLHTEHVKNLYC